MPAQVAEQVDAQDLGPCTIRGLEHTELETTDVNSFKFGETLQITLLAIPSQDLWIDFQYRNRK